MVASSYQWVFIAILILLANLPWLSQRCFLVLECAHKSPWLRLLEWLILYVLAGLLSLGVEYQATGTIHAQDWEFYWVTFFLFMVFAFPSFIYRYIR